MKKLLSFAEVIRTMGPSSEQSHLVRGVTGIEF